MNDTINERLALQIESSLTEIARIAPNVSLKEFVPHVKHCRLLLRLDAKKHCLFVYRLLLHLFLHGVELGVALGIQGVQNAIQSKKYGHT